MEHSERACWVTHYVQVWAENDAETVKTVRDMVRTGDPVRGGLGHDVAVGYLRARVRRGDVPSGAYHVQRELARNDYDRVRWSEIVTSLCEED